jgi:hypothetical protein
MALHHLLSGQSPGGRVERLTTTASGGDVRRVFGGLCSGVVV